MSFSQSLSINVVQVEGGELLGHSESHVIFSESTFENNLRVGRFAKLDTASIDNMDGSASPVIAGLVRRNVSSAVEDGGLLTTANNELIEYVRQGLVSVDVKTGETPAKFGQVYASNAGDADDGLATATNSDEYVNAEFLYEIKTDVWAIFLNATPGDSGLHEADAVGAHAASAISLLDAAGLTASIELEALATEMLPTNMRNALIADPGDAGAIPVIRSGLVALTSAGAETRTLAIPSVIGSKLVLSFDVDVGDIVLTVASAANQAGNTSLTFADAGDVIVLESIQVAGVLAWRITANDGVALA